jgi:hypothetical protein
MRSSATVLDRKPHQSRDPQTDQFARELSELCRKYGVGIAGEPTLFAMEREDYAYDYGVDKDKLIWGYEA